MIQPRSITTRLLTVVFSFYLLVAISVTGVHMTSEYYAAREQIRHELERYSDTFSKGVLLSLWEFDQEHLKSLVEGALTIPSIIGVKVVDQGGKNVIAMGRFSESTEPEGKDGGLFWDHKTLVYMGEEVAMPMTLGSLYLYSSESIVLDRILLSLTFVLINAVIKTAALWIIFILVGRRLLTWPLLRLRDAAESVDFSSLESSKIDIRSKSKNELSELQDAFNAMIEKLQHTKQERDKAESLLLQYNRDLQQKVDQRTEAIQDALRQQECMNQELVARTEALHDANARLTLLATTDALTGLLNRSEWVTQAQHEFLRSNRYQRELAVLMLDIDYFKRINDDFGHAGGDCVLKTFAAVCLHHLRVNDRMGRLGGEEFAILLPETGLEHARLLAERIRVGVEAAQTESGTTVVQITVSIGVAAVRPDDADIEVTLARADANLYRAKGTGRNKVEFTD